MEDYRINFRKELYRFLKWFESMDTFNHEDPGYLKSSVDLYNSDIQVRMNICHLLTEQLN